MKILRTPETAFEQITDFPYNPKYCEVGEGLRMHYVEEGEGPAVLLLHGEPSWAYLYRKMIPGLVAAGLRVIAPDLIGFGKSDKPSEQSDYTYAKHIQWTQTLLDHLQLIQQLALHRLHLQWFQPLFQRQHQWLQLHHCHWCCAPNLLR